ncbi:MAG: hypothetical protein SGI77_24000 [Pirellulaceae bacterium]|nr:hypothetical protein [Pirellulaceae bacterium]
MTARNCLVFFAMLFPTVEAFGGATASQWVIVVNGQSARSRTIANHYSHLRNIPSLNIITLEDVPAENTVSLDVFRERILKPLLKEMENRKLWSHIQGVAYSSDFPTAVDLSAEPKPIGDNAEYLTPVASINGMTYLFRFVLGEGQNYIAYVNNWYAQRPSVGIFTSPTGQIDSELELKLKKLRDEQEYYKLADILDDQLRSQPHQFPVAYAAAQAWALAGESAKSLQRLQQAIETGWSYSKYTQQDKTLDSLHEFSRYQALIRSCEDDPFDWTPVLAFDARKFYSPNGIGSFAINSGVSYLLSFSLAVCTTGGNTQEEVIKQLTTSAGADYTYPKGVFYYTKTEDVRTKCREAGFKVATDRLKALGFEAAITDQKIPISKTCLGVMMGEATFAWGVTKSKIVPGALCDNLTSLGGAMETSHQTKLTEFLRHGAAASSGAVTEPYSVQAKFPHPLMHASYAAGLTSAEAFYSSITGPYQLLIAGDPLCQPHTVPPRFKVVGLENGAQIAESVQVELHPSDETKTTKPQHISFLLDGQFQGKLGFPARMNISGQKLPTGAHEFRFIATDDTRLESRWEQAFWITSGPDYNQVKLTGPESWKASDKQPLAVEVFGSDSDAVIEIRHDKDYLMTVEDGRTRCEVPTDKLGTGPVRLQAVATIGTTEVASLPITVMIE